MANVFDQFDEVPVTGEPPIPQRPGQTISTGTDMLFSAATGAGEGLMPSPANSATPRAFSVTSGIRSATGSASSLSRRSSRPGSIILARL